MAILVVDDSRAMRMIVHRELRKAGYEPEQIVEAENGAVALEVVCGGNIQLVLSDWNMPDMNGLELLTAVRAKGINIAFGFVTSESGEDARGTALAAGANFVVTKPFTGGDLLRAIDSALGAGQPDVGSAGPGDSDLTIAGIFENLLGRQVSATDSEPPRKESSRAIAIYAVADGPDRAYCVLEMPLAATLGAALSRIPAARVEELSTALELPDTMDSNLYEVANVLASLASPDTRRCVLRGVTSVGPFKHLPELEGATAWRFPMEIEVEGYPGGRLGFVSP